jgi:hypothetical protein
MSRSIGPAALVVAFLGAACSQSVSPTGPGLNASGQSVSVSNQAAQDVPFKGTLEGTVTVTPLEPPLASVVISATGQATDLGRFSLLVPHTVDHSTATAEGTYTFTAANGDVLTAHFTGQAQRTPSVISIVEHAAITGGTGRFEGATGSFTAERLYYPTTGITNGSFEGTISTTGSGKD